MVEDFNPLASLSFLSLSLFSFLFFSFSFFFVAAWGSLESRTPELWELQEKKKKKIENLVVFRNNLVDMAEASENHRARSRDPMEKITKKLQQCIESKDFYQAQQLCLSLYNRQKRKDLKKAHDILVLGSKLLLPRGDVTAGNELALTLSRVSRWMDILTLMTPWC